MDSVKKIKLKATSGLLFVQKKQKSLMGIDLVLGSTVEFYKVLSHNFLFKLRMSLMSVNRQFTMPILLESIVV